MCGIAYTLAPTAALSVAALVPYNFFASFAFGAAVAAVQEITPNRMRAQVGCAVRVGDDARSGLGLGPSMVGLLTDRVFGDDAAVRYSLLVVTVVGLGAAAGLLAAGLAPYRRSVAYRASVDRRGHRQRNTLKTFEKSSVQSPTSDVGASTRQPGCNASRAWSVRLARQHDPLRVHLERHRLRWRDAVSAPTMPAIRASRASSTSTGSRFR